MESSRVPCVSRGKQTERAGVHDTARDIITGRWMLAIVSPVYPLLTCKWKLIAEPWMLHHFHR